MINQISNTEDISNLETYRGNLKDIKGSTFVVSFAGLKNLQEEANNLGIKFKTDMLQNSAGYLVTLE